MFVSFVSNSATAFCWLTNCSKVSRLWNSCTQKAEGSLAKLSPTTNAQSSHPPDKLNRLKSVAIDSLAARNLLSQLPRSRLPCQVVSDSRAKCIVVMNAAKDFADQCGFTSVDCAISSLFERRSRPGSSSRPDEDTLPTKEDQPGLAPVPLTSDGELPRETSIADSPALDARAVKERIGSSKRRQESVKAVVITGLKMLMMICKFFSCLPLLSNTQSNLARFSLLCDQWYVAW